ncbi:MAG: MTH1187 family thiamine-binding protein [Deltaproteobacteria bacterium]|nr:MTH1187 family thiamine-binding protein [Deltaproteobacteria bacterium]MBW2447165.1 MTH1187 family thiamine-binding protein [Deltaproteobacteria bacterium]
MAIVAVSIAPIGASTSVGPYVAAALRVARAQTRISVELGAMFTTLEGELGEIFALIQDMQEAVFEAGAERVSTVVKIDERRDRAASASEKVRAVEALLEE